MTQKGLKSMKEFPNDVKEGDIVRIVLKKSGVLAGHVHQETVPLWHDLKMVRLSVSQNPVVIKDEITRMHNPSDYTEIMYMLGDEEFTYRHRCGHRGDGVERAQRILGYEVLKRKE